MSTIYSKGGHGLYYSTAHRYVRSLCGRTTDQRGAEFKAAESITCGNCKRSKMFATLSTHTP